MVASMTGFARESGTQGRDGWVWELKSVNGRGLDVRLRLPPELDALSEEVRKAVQGRFARGTLHVSLLWQQQGRAAPAVRVNEEALAALAETAAALAARTGLPAATLDGLLAIRGIVEVEEHEDGPGVLERLRGPVMASFAAALAGLDAARREEGAAIASVLERQVAEIERLAGAVGAHPARSAEAVRGRLAAAIAALSETSQALDPVRLHQEAALLATRADIREELDRLEAHLATARELLREDGPIGRKLDFVAQEFGREASTLCAKAGHVEISKLGLDLRTVVDQFREQVQNVE